VIEKSLSVDNIFVFVLIFGYFQIPAIYQHKVLFWGILGALVMRVIFIFAGVALIEKFHWTIYLFGVFLIYTGYKMFSEKDGKMEPEKNPVIKFSRKILPVTKPLPDPTFRPGRSTIPQEKITWCRMVNSLVAGFGNICG
jgi:tellurite resistance protein TerC